MNPRLYSFVGGSTGSWRVLSIQPVIGDTLPYVPFVDVVQGQGSQQPSSDANASWVLRGVTSNERYVARDLKQQLQAKQVAIGRATATRAALIPIRKNAQWWALTQEHRLEIFEETSRHTRTGLRYLPAIARRLHHCRDLATAEPFDFLTFFDYSPEDAQAFEQLLAELRTTPEWGYVDREVDIRLIRV